MRRKYIAMGDKWVEVKPTQKTGYMVMPDIEPYTSMITGETITSRSKHRQHLKDHSCIEIGNDYHIPMDQMKKPIDVDPKGRHELIRSQISTLSEKEFRKMLNRSIQPLKG